MLARNDHAESSGVTDVMKSIFTEEKFAEIAEGMVADFAPRVFAIFQEYGERVDGRIAAWGMAFEDHAEVVGVDGGVRMNVRKPENALRAFAWGDNISTRLIWFNPDAITGAEEGDEDDE